MEIKNLSLNCKDCGTVFTMSPQEQQFFYDRLLVIPKRCPACRAKNRLALKQRAQYFSGGGEYG
jgi:hypothetical protein